jgi:hypothetical protein
MRTSVKWTVALLTLAPRESDAQTTSWTEVIERTLPSVVVI